jgi:hypothetical protein
MGRANAGEPAILFCQLVPRVGLLVFLLVSPAIDDENCFKFKWLWYCAVTGQGHQKPSLKFRRANV